MADRGAAAAGRSDRSRLQGVAGSGVRGIHSLDCPATFREALNIAHPDHLNTPRLVADFAGTTVWKWDQQEPFGVTTPDENPSSLGTFEFNLRFPGQYFDKESNASNNWMRDYDATIGRYIESDPIGLRSGLNTYAYVGSTPLNFTDPMGLQVYVCSRPADLSFPLNYFDHYWIKTNELEAGLGAQQGVIPAQRNIDIPFVTMTQTVSHTGESSQSNTQCVLQNSDIDESCVNARIRPGIKQGRWNLGNNCSTFVQKVLSECKRSRQDSRR